jgi:hypothetical protein
LHIRSRVKVLLIVIDGASPRVLCPAVQVGRLPNIKRLADAGEMHQSSVTIFPSITPAATASIVTGAYPMEHGITGAAWYDDARGEVAYYGDDVWVIARQGFGTFLRDFLVRLNGDRLKAPTVFEMIERTGRRTGSLNYLIYRGLVTHRVHVPWTIALLPGVPLVETIDGPSLLCLGDFVTSVDMGRKPPHKHGLPHRFGMDDDSTRTLLTYLVERGQLPDLTVAYFADNDFRSHEVGPVAALPVLDRVDEALGAMFDAAGGAERFMSDTCVVITSDHGHCDILADASKAAVQLDRVLGDIPQGTLNAGWTKQAEILICPNMRAAQVYLRHPSSAGTARVARAALRDPRVDLALWRDEDGDGVAYRVLSQRGELRFWRHGPGGESAVDAYGTEWRCAGDLETLQMTRCGRSLESSEYPNAFERIAGALDSPRSGEVWLTAQPGCEFEVPGGAAHLNGGSHGALHALDSETPVIAAGFPRRLPRAMRCVDIAPLCLQALGMEMRYDVGDARVSG